MDAKQQAHVKMLITTRDVLDNFKILWLSIIALATARTQFGAAIKAIQDTAKNQAETTTGGTEDKHVARGVMCDTAALVGGAIAAWADTQNNHELFNAVDFSAPDLMHMNEHDCGITCQAILDAGIANLAALTAVNSLAQTDLDDLQAKLDAFNKHLTVPRQIRAKISGATDLIPGLITAADRIVERQIDKLMERYKSTNPDFYSAYNVARVIVSQGGGSAAKPAPVTQTGTTPEPVTTTPPAAHH